MKSLIVILFVVYCFWAQAVTMYVSPTGNNSNTRTSGLPFLTIQAAVNLAIPGDTVLVRDGVYTNRVPNYASEIAIVRIINSGTRGHMITIKAEHRHGAVLDGENYNATHGIMLDEGASYIRIEGFEIKHVFLWAFPVFPGSTNVEFRENYIHHIGNKCAVTTNGISAFNLMRTDTVLVERNMIHDIGRLDPEEGCAGSLYYKYNDHGLYLDGCKRATIRYNVIYNIHAGFAVQFYSSGGYANDKIYLYNNTLGFGKWASGMITIYNDVSNSIIRNNIFYQNITSLTRVPESTNDAIAINTSEGYSYSSILIDHNMVYNGSGKITGSTPTGFTIASNYQYTDPIFVDTDFRTLQLQESSPAINAGVDVGLTVDYFNRPIAGLPDVGAYEYGIYIAPPVRGKVVVFNGKAIKKKDKIMSNIEASQ